MKGKGRNKREKRKGRREGESKQAISSYFTKRNYQSKCTCTFDKLYILIT